MRAIAVRAALLSCALGLIGCMTPAMQEDAARVRVLEPRPLVDLPDSAKGMKLEIDSSVGDRFTIAQRDGITAVPVEGWHSSLQNGFTNGPGRFFKGNPAEADALKLTILNAELDYVPTAVFTRGVNVVGAAAVQARIRYVARLIDSKGDVLARDQGEVFSTSQWTGPGGSSTTASEAIATMYQNISKQIVAALE